MAKAPSVTGARTAVRRPEKIDTGKTLGMQRETFVALLFLTPAFIGFLVFYLIPALRGVYLSFTDFNLLRNSGSWIGLRNYNAMIHDTLFWNALWITFKYVVINIGIQTVLA